MNFLIVLGASVRAMAFSAVRAGLQPIAYDLFADHDLTAICPAQKINRYPADFLTAVANAPNVPWMYTGGLENYPHWIDRLSQARPLLGNSGTIVRAARDPVRFGRVVSASGLCYPDIDSKSNSQRQLLKLRRSSGGLGVRFATAAEIQRPPRGAYLQQYVKGDSWSSVFVGTGHEAELIGLTRQWIGGDFGLPQPFLYVGNIGPMILPESAIRQLRVLGNNLANTFGLLGLFNVDLIRRDDAFWALEVNPRYSASIEVLERGLNFPAIKLHIDACHGKISPLELTHPPQQLVGKVIVYARHDGVVPQSLNTIAAEWNTDPARPKLADLPHPGDFIHAGQPVVTVLAEGATVEQVEQELRRQVAVIQNALQDQ